MDEHLVGQCSEAVLDPDSRIVRCGQNMSQQDQGLVVRQIERIVNTGFVQREMHGRPFLTGLRVIKGISE